MPAFTAPDGTTLAYHVMGEGEPLLCLPGGPMRASAYLGDLGGLSAHRRPVLLDLRGTGASGIPTDPATYRCDHQAADVEALREHLGAERIDVLAHSAAGDLALLHAARYPQRIRSLTPVTARARALGIDFTGEHRREAAAMRAAEPWFPAAHAAYETVWTGTPTDADWDAIAPFLYGRWDAAAQAHAASDVARTNAAGLRPLRVTRRLLPRRDPRRHGRLGRTGSDPRRRTGQRAAPRVAAGIVKLFPRAELAVQPGSGHSPWLDAPGLFTRVVSAFLSRERVGPEERS
ncbi:alpha/beta fold hydrolase [Streptomyces pinistramenti]|uniref:alpha/beta fold hydrolase n=1 Tax=Streptomyces pinistramenti TaxID=2884812 RepID=UPI001D0933F1|nr:alpha/beta hydrolase [Streptomyces pinistramenti]MCB5908958.1 alpha/beta hydrolase [Streptomyces pinistramenti]